MSVRFIAEVSSNHNRDLERCLRFVDTAAVIGCDGVKFQLFRINELFAPEILSRSEEHRRREAWELPIEFIPEIAGRCSDRNIEFGCTPFYLSAIEELLPYVDFYKIASYELLWTDLIAACAMTGKPLILSTGMATLEEIKQAVETFRDSGGKNLTLLHCVSTYPTPQGGCNLAAIETLRAAANVDVGWSDHSVSPVVIERAIYRWGASVIEFHLDLDGEGAEYATGHCWLADQMQQVIEHVGAPHSTDGSGVKEPLPSEEDERKWRADPSDGLRPFKSIRATAMKLSERETTESQPASRTGF